ncbi:tyrosine--tRNA ligase [Rudaeicoccus suwonensis]|uniref:Tyrosine--tRNA ligase n=1 Tax=Rudaeicoccus suwonensis TaxID=657409 RepID=A0A561EA34_9MICO|nr:tyrosine--tRNA ligase [Rudaeicoccus suwonensis]TWE12476.1 tyrosyl-tRNA synthetase [Rudaeicoccus suwonensis]
MSGIFDELMWRGLVAQSTDETALRAALDEGPITMYVGFDPSADSLHIGNLVQLIVARKMQRAGHRVLCLVGGSTGLIGDPKPDSERVLRDKEQVAGAVEAIRREAASLLDFTGDNPAMMVNNLDWTEPISALDFLRDYGKHFRVNAMIKKDAVSRRLNSEQGISYTEFSYQILQALDFLHLHRAEKCTLQLGGSDQWGNLLAGVDLIRSAEGVSVHAMTTPLVTDASGRKYGKSEGNALWLSPELMSPYAFYQFWINMDDADVVEKLRIFTDFTREEMDEFERQVADEPFRRTAQKALAESVTTLVHGGEATAAAQAASEALFGKGDVTALDPRTLADATAELPGGEVRVGDTIIDVLIALDIADSRNSARRLIGDGGVSVNNVKVSDVDAVITADDFLHGSVAIVKRGRKHLCAARLTQD